MPFNSTPNMNLPIPIVGQEAGPQYAIDVNSCFTLLDQHDHTPGKGIAITPSGININAALSFNNNFASSLAGTNFQAQSSTPGINTMYVSGVDYYLVDGSGNNIRLTQSGGIVGSPGSISGLTSPASATYVSGLSTFVWQSNTNIAANMDFGAAIMRNLSPNSTFALTLQPPAALSANYTITLPALPAVPAFLTINSSGTISASPILSGGLVASNLSATAGITGSQLSASANINGSQLSATAGITPGQSNSFSSGNYVTIGGSSGSFGTSSVTPVTVTNWDFFLPANFSTTRPAFLSFAWDGVANSSNINIGPSGNVTFTFQLYTGVSTVANVHIVSLGAGIYPASILNTIAPFSASWTGFTGRIRVQVQCSSGTNVSVNNTVMSAYQV